MSALPVNDRLRISASQHTSKGKPSTEENDFEKQLKSELPAYLTSSKTSDVTMAELDGAELRSRGSLEFTESSILDTIVPLNSHIDIGEALGGSVERLDEGNHSPLATIPQRHALFFGQFLALPLKLCILLIRR